MSGTATIPVTPSMGRVDGTTLNGTSDLKQLNGYLSVDGGANFTNVATLPPTATQFVLQDLSPGSYLFHASETDQFGQESAMSAPVSFTIAAAGTTPVATPARPNAPVLGTPVQS